MHGTDAEWDVKLLFAFSGTRGDIQPAAVIGAELQRRGHVVTFAAPPNLVEFAAGFGVDVVPFGYDTRAHMKSELVRTRVRSGGPVARLKAFNELRDVGWVEMIDTMVELSEGADAIVTGFTTEQVALLFAEHHGIALISLHHAPVRSNSYFSPFPGAPLSLAPLVNRVSWKLVDAALWGLTRKRENRERARMGMASAGTDLPTRMRKYGAREIQAYDPLFCADLAEEWGADRPMVGFVGLGDSACEWSEDAEGLRDWMAEGTPPIYFGFGSMPVADPGALVMAIGRACRGVGERAVVSAGWNDFDVSSDDTVRIVGQVDHRTVLPACRAVVHHGGAGTTSAALRAAKPAVVCSVGSDQPFWGAQLERLGVGASMTLSQLDAHSLEDRLRTVLDPQYTRRANAVAAQLISPEKAATAAADLIEASVTDWSPAVVTSR
jgi:UDP:flavonoid glycosyltransferase YjiC (YdhE family)